MKSAGRLLILLTAAALVAQAQAGPGLQEAPAAVLKFSWSKERVDWERDPFGGPLENFDEMRARARNEKRIDDAKRGGGGMAADHATREARADAANLKAARRDKPPRYGFVYKATIRNDAAKAITAVDWDYVFTDAATGEEIGRRRFASEERIGPGKKKELSFFVPDPPARRISAHALDRRERDGLGERVLVVRVLYEDGTVWPAREGGASLRNRRPLRAPPPPASRADQYDTLFANAGQREAAVSAFPSGGVRRSLMK